MMSGFRRLEERLRFVADGVYRGASLTIDGRVWLGLTIAALLLGGSLSLMVASDAIVGAGTLEKAEIALNLNKVSLGMAAGAFVMLVAVSMRALADAESQVIAGLRANKKGLMQ